MFFFYNCIESKIIKWVFYWYVQVFISFIWPQSNCFPDLLLYYSSLPIILIIWLIVAMNAYIILLKTKVTLSVSFTTKSLNDLMKFSTETKTWDKSLKNLYNTSNKRATGHWCYKLRKLIKYVLPTLFSLLM